MSWYSPYSAGYGVQSSGYGISYNEAGAEKTAGGGVAPIDEMSTNAEIITSDEGTIERHIWIFVTLLACSGIFSSTFTLTFAYISDTVRSKKDRVSAYGLALATFGLSFTIGPMLGGYLAKVEATSYGSDLGGDIVEDGDIVVAGATDRVQDEYPSPYPLGQRRVFLLSFILTVLDLCYIYFILPESKSTPSTIFSPTRARINRSFEEDSDEDDDCSQTTFDSRATIGNQWNQIRHNVIPNSWSPLDAMKIFSNDPLMYEVGYIAFFYYTSLWAVVSTLVLYAAKRFHLTPERLGELMSALGLSTMISEAVLVRIVVPSIGEKKSMRLGLIAFTFQCIVLGFAYESWQLFICVLLSILGNLVYPSLSSLVSNSCHQDMVGEALGAINGVKALTEGLGPLVFGILMSFSERSALPGWPYLVAAIFSYIAYKRSRFLPDENDEEYISEKYNKNEEESEEEYAGLLSEIDEISEEEVVRNNKLIQENDVKR